MCMTMTIAFMGLKVNVNPNPQPPVPVPTLTRSDLLQSSIEDSFLVVVFTIKCRRLQCRCHITTLSSSEPTISSRVCAGGSILGQHAGSPDPPQVLEPGEHAHERGVISHRHHELSADHSRHQVLPAHQVALHDP